MSIRRWLLLVVLVLVGAPPTAAQFAPPVLELGFANPGARSLGLAGAFVALADDATAAYANPAGLNQLQRPEVSLEVRGELDFNFGVEGQIVGGSAVGFASFVYPRRRFAVALYRHQLADASLRLGTAAPLADGTPWLGIAVADLTVRVVGVAASWRVSDKLDVGLGLASYGMDVRGTFDELTLGTRERIRLGSYSGDSNDLRLTGGVLWDFAKGLRFGAFYRQGPRFEIDYLGTFADPATPPVERRDTPLTFADTSGAGVAWRTAGDRLTLAFEWTHVASSRVLGRFDPEVFDTASFALDDGDHLRLGAEWIFLGVTPVVALRVGAWREDAPALRRRDAAGRPVAGLGLDLDHTTAGVGVAWRKFQLDLGIDSQGSAIISSLSLVYSF